MGRDAALREESSSSRETWKAPHWEGVELNQIRQTGDDPCQ